MQNTSQPRVRSACEPCHERKQRCIVPEQGGPCQSCQQSSRSCFFIPRYKAGRPRRHDSATGSTACPNPADGQPSPSPLSSSSSGNLQRRPDYFSPQNAVEPAPVFAEAAADPEPDMMTMENYDNMNNMDMFISSSSSSSDSNMGIPIANMLEFALPQGPVPDAVLSLTEKYAEMHRHELLLRQNGNTAPSLPSSRTYLLPNFIASIESACTHALSLSRANPTTRDQDTAVSALLLATMLKVILLSEAILVAVESQHSNESQQNYHNASGNGAGPLFQHSAGAIDVDSALVFKQLDMCLAQAKHCLYQVGRQQQVNNTSSFTTQETLHKTRDLHVRISRLIDRVYDAQWH